MGFFKAIKNAFVDAGHQVGNIAGTVKALPVQEFDGINAIESAVKSSITDDVFDVVDGRLTVGGRNIDDAEFIYKSGNVNEALDLLGSPRVDANTANTFSQTVARKYPEPTINRNNAVIDADRPNLNRLGGDDQEILADLNTGGNSATDALNRIDSASNTPGTFWETLWTRAKRVGQVTLLVGGITVGALALSDLIKTVNAVNNGCYLSTYQGNGVITRRVVGYTCGEGGGYGDQVYIDEGHTVANHPAETVIGKPTCQGGEKDCTDYCDPQQMRQDIADYLAKNLPENQYIFCKKQSFSDSIVDIATGIGSGVGDIIGGTVGGLFGSFGIVFWLILAIAAVILIIVLIAKFAPSRPAGGGGD
jgi:hypothetical protein